MADVRSNLKYTEDHEWISLDGDIATIGITDYAQGELGDVVFLELPEVGDTFDQGDTVGSIEAVKTVVDIFAPLAGEVTEINEALDDEPETVNSSPYEDGWLLKIKINDSAQLDSLMDADAYTSHIG